MAALPVILVCHRIHLPTAMEPWALAMMLQTACSMTFLDASSPVSRGSVSIHVKHQSLINHQYADARMHVTTSAFTSHAALGLFV